MIKTDTDFSPKCPVSNLFGSCKECPYHIVECLDTCFAFHFQTFFPDRSAVPDHVILSLVPVKERILSKFKEVIEPVMQFSVAFVVYLFLSGKISSLDSENLREQVFVDLDNRSILDELEELEIDRKYIFGNCKKARRRVARKGFFRISMDVFQYYLLAGLKCGGISFPSLLKGENDFIGLMNVAKILKVDFEEVFP